MKWLAERLLGQAMWFSVGVMALALIDGQAAGQYVEQKHLASDGAASVTFGASKSNVNVGLPCDFNGDGFITISDFFAWLNNPTDVNGDGNINSADTLCIFDNLPEGFEDCTGNGLPDLAEIRLGEVPDCNGDDQPDECDLSTLESSDCDNNGIPDECEVNDYQIDNGRSSVSWGTNADQDWIWLNRMIVGPGQETIRSISVVWSRFVPDGRQFSLLLYDDPNNDGDPTDAVLLLNHFAINTLQDELNIFERFAVPPTVVGNAGDSFFVGMQHRIIPPSNPAVIDRSGLFESWLGRSAGGTGDLNDLTNWDFPVSQPAVVITGAWMIRADATHGPGVPSACLDRGDTNGDGLVNVTDLLTLLASWGSCGGCPADFNSDSMVNVTDLLNLLGNWG